MKYSDFLVNFDKCLIDNGDGTFSLRTNFTGASSGSMGNNTSDTYPFSSTGAVLYVSNAFTDNASTANKAAVFKAAQKNTANTTTATTEGLVGYGTADMGAFNAGFIYGSQFQAQGRQGGGSIESLIGNNGIANFVSTHQGNITNSLTGVLGTAQANATGASASGTVPVANGVWGQFLKSTTDKLTVTEANNILSGGSLINSAVGTFYGFHFKEDTGAGTITTEYGLYLEAVTRGTTSVGAYIGGGTTAALWVDTGETRLDGNVLVGGLTAAGTSAAGVIAISNAATAPSDSVDKVHLYAVDLSAGNAMLGIFAETAAQAAVAIASTHKIPIKYNGATLYLLASNV